MLRTVIALSLLVLAALIVVPPGGIVEDRAQVIAGLENFRVSSITVDDNAGPETPRQARRRHR